MAMAKKHILDGVRVLDLTNVLSGPFATLHLALLGAEVIKIENPKDGDLARKLGIVPEYNKRLMGTSFLAQNANKKSVTLNTKSPEGKDIFKRLVKDADVVVENFRPDVMERLGLSLQGALRDQPEARLLRHLGLRPDRPRRDEARLRPDHPGAERARWRSTATSGSTRCAPASRSATRWAASTPRSR